MRPRHRVLMLLANNPYPQDGRVRREATTLVREGYRVDVICPRFEDQVSREVIDGVVVHRYRLPVAGTGTVTFVFEHLYTTLASLVLSLRLSLRGGFDVVHMHNPPDLLVAVAATHKAMGKRIVYDHHDLAPEMYAVRFGPGASPVVSAVLLWLERVCCRVADHVLASNQSYAALVRERHGVAPERITVVRNGPEMERFQAAAPDPAVRGEVDIVLCYAGTIGPQDGVDHLLHAMRRVLAKPRPSVRCLIVGDGDALPSLRALAADLQLNGSISFVGQVPPEEIGRYIASADICVEPAPSNAYNDRSTMIKIMEYLAVGKPVVAFDLPENRVTAGPFAEYVPPNDDEAFSQAIFELAGDPERRSALGEGGYRRVEEELAWHHVAPHLLEAYRTVLEAPGGPRR